MWTCPKGHERPLADELNAVRDMVALLGFSHYCPDCQTPYVLPPEAQHRLLQILEHRHFAEWIDGEVLGVRGRQWTITPLRLRLIARLPPDVAEIEAMADAGDDAPRVRLTARVSVTTLRTPELVRRRLKEQLERQLAQP